MPRDPDAMARALAACEAIDAKHKLTPEQEKRLEEIQAEGAAFLRDEKFYAKKRLQRQRKKPNDE